MRPCDLPHRAHCLPVSRRAMLKTGAAFLASLSLGLRRARRRQ